MSGAHVAEAAVYALQDLMKKITAAEKARAVGIRESRIIARAAETAEESGAMLPTSTEKNTHSASIVTAVRVDVRLQPYLRV